MKSTRRAFVGSLLVFGAAACAPVPQTGLRGTGTVWRPDDPPLAAPPVEGMLSTMSHPSTPTPEPPAPARPTGPGESEAQAHVLPIPASNLPTANVLPPKRLVIPSIRVDSKVISIGTYVNQRGERVWETAPFAVGHHRGTADPGRAGNMVLSGHISSPREGDVFRHLPELKLDVGIVVATDDRQYLYRVVQIQVVTPDAVSVLDPTPEPTLTLLTCVPDGIYSHRLVVTAALV